MEADIQAQAMIERRINEGMEPSMALLASKESVRFSIQAWINKLRRCNSDEERKSICNNLCFDDEVLTELRKL